MQERSWPWVLVVLITAALSAALAHAQVSPSEKAAAEALFDRGLAQLKEGKLEEACASLEQSQTIERGIGTMLYLADCYERTGRTASAWALFREASSEARASGQAERAEAGRERAERIEPNLARLTIEVPERVRVTGLEVLRDGVVVPSGAWNVPLPIDPGQHRIEARASGHVSHVQLVQIEKGPSVRVIALPALEAQPTAAEPVAATPEPGPVIAEPSAPPPALPERGKKQRITGIVLGSVGVALLAIGGGFGIQAIKKNNLANDKCPLPQNQSCAEQEGVDASKTAKRAGTISTVGFAAGGALLAGGLVTYFLAPRSDTKVSIAADRQMAVIQVGGVF